MRLAHKVMAHTLFGRAGSFGSMRSDELPLLYCMTHPRNVMNCGVFLAKHLKQVARAKQDDIVVGRFITAIARELRISLVDMTDIVLPGPNGDRIDVAALRHAKILECHNGVSYYQFKGGELELSNPDLISVRGDDALAFDPNSKSEEDESSGSDKEADDETSPQLRAPGTRGISAAPSSVDREERAMLVSLDRRLASLEKIILQMDSWMTSQGFPPTISPPADTIGPSGQ